MRFITAITSGILIMATQIPVHASNIGQPGLAFSTDQEYLLLALGSDHGEDRRDERGRSDERQDKRDCRQDEGRVGKDKRDCKQEEVRDGVRGNQGERVGNGND